MIPYGLLHVLSRESINYYRRVSRMNPCPDCGKPTQGTAVDFIGANLHSHSPRCKVCFDKKAAELPHVEVVQ